MLGLNDYLADPFYAFYRLSLIAYQFIRVPRFLSAFNAF